MRGSVASHMLQFGSGQVVTKIVADISTRRRNVDVAAVSNAQFLPGTWRVVHLPESSARSNDPEFEKEYRSYLMSWKNSSENFHAIQKSSRFSKENQRRSITSPGPAIAPSIVV